MFYRPLLTWDDEIVAQQADQKREAASDGEPAEPPIELGFRCARCRRTFATRRAYNAHWMETHA